MSFEIIAIIVLLIMFVIGSTLPVNIGVMGFVAAFIVGSLFSGLSLDDIYSVFPSDLFILLAGITFLFSIIQKSGTVDLIADWGLRLVKGNVGLIPWLMFVLSMILTSIGTSGIAVVSILAPIALRIAYQNKISQLMMGVLIVMGVNAGSFTQLNIFGVIINGVMESRNLSYSPSLLVVNCIIYFALVSAIFFTMFGGFRLLKSKTSAFEFVAATVENEYENNSNEKQGKGLDLYKGVTLGAIGILIILVIGFDINIGFAAFIVGLILSILFPHKQDGVVKEMPWGVVFLITGIMTYVGVLELIGVMDYITNLISDMDNSVMASLAVSYVGGIVSAFASTTGFLAAVIPMATPILQDPSISSLGVLSAVAASSSIVDLSPLSSVGALLLTNVQGIKERVFFKQLLVVALTFIVLGPGLAWLLFVVIGMPW
ncbi:MAG TPA: SLC13 family permease [Ureibacillus sp.]|nr:SLC13 family permease [Ureibacillus sp.]